MYKGGTATVTLRLTLEDRIKKNMAFDNVQQIKMFNVSLKIAKIGRRHNLLFKNEIGVIGLKDT